MKGEKGRKKVSKIKERKNERIRKNESKIDVIKKERNIEVSK